MSDFHGQPLSALYGAGFEDAAVAVHSVAADVASALTRDVRRLVAAVHTPTDDTVSSVLVSKLCRGDDARFAEDALDRLSQTAKIPPRLRALRARVSTARYRGFRKGIRSRFLNLRKAEETLRFSKGRPLTTRDDDAPLVSKGRLLREAYRTQAAAAGAECVEARWAAPPAAGLALLTYADSAHTHTRRRPGVSLNHRFDLTKTHVLSHTKTAAQSSQKREIFPERRNRRGSRRRNSTRRASSRASAAPS